MDERLFEKWFHAHFLSTYGPVDPSDPESVRRHRMLKNWCELAWIEGRASTYDQTEGA